MTATTLLAHLDLLPPSARLRPPQLRLATCQPPSPSAGQRSASWLKPTPRRNSIRASAASPPSIEVLTASPPTADGIAELAGFNAKGKKTLAHPDYHLIQRMWHPTKNEGTQPADYTHKTSKRVWLLCPGCIHGCGRRHEWEASVFNLTRKQTVCPFCESKGGHFCPCRSVAADARLSREWDAANPLPAAEVPLNSHTKYLWQCPNGHDPYATSCVLRHTCNTGCPVCFKQSRGTSRHPLLSEGRPDLVEEWDSDRNEKSPHDVTLGSNVKAHWECGACSYRWQTKVYHRALQGTGCPRCSTHTRFRPRLFGPVH